ncbi:zinc ribbon domain-containing protein [Streptomyces sp. NPDC059970]|uniref:zinc ribbon domain-containing protein n=1 Tax=Streptomyces sp. NPDC059970 TaxID=3347019 RepID=UPI0036A8561E
MRSSQPFGLEVKHFWRRRREEPPRAGKCRLYGSELRRPVPPFHTSQTCAACGRTDPQSRKDCGRLFACVHCGHEDDLTTTPRSRSRPSPPGGGTSHALRAMGRVARSTTARAGALGAESRPPAEADA